MKKILLLVATLFFCLKGISQEYPEDWVYDEVVYLKDSTIQAGQIHNLAKLFIANQFKSAKDVIQLDDEKNQILIVKGLITTYGSFLGSKIEHGYVNFTLKLQSKNGRYKYTISDFYHEIYAENQVSIGSLNKEKPGGGVFGIGVKNFNKLKEYLHQDVENLILSMKNSIDKGMIKDDF